MHISLNKKFKILIINALLLPKFMNISSEQIKLLREKSGAGMQNCKNALIETDGHFEKALTYLRTKGLASAEKKLTRVTQQGIITSYIHTGSKIGVLLELNCETDFVARRPEFQNLARNLAMQIAATESINYIALKDIPQSAWDSELQIESAREDIKDKPADIKKAILQGRVQKIFKERTLLDQKCLRDNELTVEEYIKSFVSLLGENIKVSRFIKFVLGEK